MTENTLQALRLSVRSETDALRHVIVHTPGPEMDLVSPQTREDLLFEDILYLKEARTEHARMCRVFSKIVGDEGTVLQIGDLLRQAFDIEDARLEFVSELCRSLPMTNLQAVAPDLRQLSPDELHTFALSGVSPLPVTVPPLPNLLFTRDLAAVVHDHVILSHPATSARKREALVMSTVLNHHPDFAEAGGRIIKLPAGTSFEGGDLIVADAKTVIIGHSERTSFGGVMNAAKSLIQRTPIEQVVFVNLPKQRWCMHLDTVFTFAAPDTCVAYLPLIELSGLGNVVVLRAGGDEDRLDLQVMDSLQHALEDTLGRDLTFVPCGGHSLLAQQREQWTDGANFFSPAPGVVIGYERNGETFDMMAEHGFRVVTAESFLSFYESSSFDQNDRVAIKLEGHELSRGRGGPRCMTLPIARQAAN